MGTRGSENPGSNPLRSRVATAGTRSPSRGTSRNVPDDPGVEPPRLRLGRFEKITAEVQDPLRNIGFGVGLLIFVSYFDQIS